MIETVVGSVWSSIDSRVFEHDGCIVDIGCLTWDWSEMFFPIKRVIGVDPFENEIPKGAELFKGLVGPIDAKVMINHIHQGSSLFNNFDTHNETWRNRHPGVTPVDFSISEPAEEFPMLSWKSFCTKYNIDKISVLKINIEGGEYSLLHSMDSEDFEKIDQIVVSFHHWINYKWNELTESAIFLLEKMGFELTNTCYEYGWYLALKKQQTNEQLYLL